MNVGPSTRRHNMRTVSFVFVFPQAGHLPPFVQMLNGTDPAKDAHQTRPKTYGEIQH